MILVTGAAGFIGSNIVAALNARGRRDIVLCDRLRTGDKWRNLRRSAFARHVPPEALTGWLAERPRLDAVIHMGAISSTTASDGDEVMASNFSLSLALLEFCAAAGIPYLYASSAAVYGDGEEGFADAFDPEAVLRLAPLNLYGWSKRQFDVLVADRLASGGALPPVCAGFRFFNVFGPNEYHKDDMRSLVAKIAGPVAAGERISLFQSHRDGIADGDQRRDFVYVKDAVEAVLWFLGPSAPSGIFNIGTGVARSFRELAEATFRAFGREPAIDYRPMPEAIRDRYQYFTQADLTRLRAAGYQGGFLSLEDAVSDYVRQHLSQADPYR